MANTLDTHVTRYEAPQKVSGQTRYAADFMPAGMLHGALAISPIARGRITAIDVAAAQAEPGVIAVFTHETLPKFEPPKGFASGGAGTASFTPMTGPEIRYAGQPVAYVVAANAAAARRGAALVKADYAESAARMHMDDSRSEFGAGQGDEGRQGQRRQRHSRRCGHDRSDLRAAFHAPQPDGAVRSHRAMERQPADAVDAVAVGHDRAGRCGQGLRHLTDDGRGDLALRRRRLRLEGRPATVCAF